MEQLIEFVPEALFILIAALYCLGLFLKQSKVKDNYIPLILLALGVAGALVVNGFNATSLMQGVIAAACAVFVKNIEKQLTKKKEDPKEEKEII